MPLRTESLDEPSLNLTPMIDIVFLLIIFFMVGTRFSEIEQQYDVELPTAAPMEMLSQQPDPMILTVSRSGAMAVNGKPMSLEQVREELTAAKKAWADQPVLIRGDGDGTYQAIIDVMNLCHSVQIRKFSLAFQPVEQKPAP